MAEFDATTAVPTGWKLQYRPDPTDRVRPDLQDWGLFQFHGPTRFALALGTDAVTFNSWRNSDFRWIPTPDVIIEDISYTGSRVTRPGWSMLCIEVFRRRVSGAVFRRPKPCVYVGRRRMQRDWNLTQEQLWKAVAARLVVAPDVWVDEEPGWSPKHATPPDASTLAGFVELLDSAHTPRTPVEGMQVTRTGDTRSVRRTVRNK